MKGQLFKQSEIGMIPENWEVRSLHEVADVLTGFPFEGEKYSDKGTRVLRGENVSVGFLRWDTEKRWSHSLEGLDKYRLSESDIVIGMDGSKVGQNRAQIRNSDLPLLLAQRVARVRAKPPLDQGYLYYNIFSDKFLSHVEAVRTGTSIPHISSTQIGELKLAIPPPSEQAYIAKILSDFDSKIQVDQQVGKTLERMVQALFKHWFVDFEFPNDKGMPYKSNNGAFINSEHGPIPVGWKISNVGNEVEIGGGTTPDTTDPKYWDDGKYHWTTPKDLSELSGPILLDTSRKITELGLKAIGGRLYSEGVLLLSSRAPIGYLAISEIPTAINQGIIAITARKTVSSYYMMGWCQASIEEIRNRANGTTFLEISKSDFRQMPIITPPEDLMNKFDLISESIYSSISSRTKESIVIQEMRDSLIPRLISGKIRIPTEAR